jgi:hypothetical protein
MPRLRQAVAQKVADRLFAVESAIDVALTRAAELTAAMPSARTEARLPAMVGQTALDRAAEAFTALVEARRRIVETHAHLDEARLQIGLREVDTGSTEPKIPPGVPYEPGASAEFPTVSRIRAVA